MEKLIRFCDHCGRDVPGVIRFPVTVGLRRDPNEGRSEDMVEDLDLCPDAQATIVGGLIRDMSHAGRAALVKRWKRNVYEKSNPGS